MNLIKNKDIYLDNITLKLYLVQIATNVNIVKLLSNQTQKQEHY